MPVNRIRPRTVSTALWCAVAAFATTGIVGADSLKLAAPFPMGVGIQDRVFERPEDWPLLTSQFGYITPENSMKPAAVQGEPGRWNFETPDRFVAFAGAKDLKVVGHCLVWAKDDRTPPWFALDGDAPVTREVLLERMKTHIDTVVGRYRGKIAMWDVVNEALDDGAGYLRDSCWTRSCGEEFIAKAFEYAHAADPDALLIYNDYNNELEKKFPKMMRLIESLRAQNVPLHAIGLQGHYEIDAVPFDALEKTLSAMRAIGMKVVVSELDIDVIPRGRWWANDGAEREELAKLDPYAAGCPPEILQRQAEQYARLFRLFRKYSDTILRISFWNLHDGQSWLNDFPWKRVNYPLLFDRQGKPKPAYEAVLQALTEPEQAAAGAERPRVIVSTDIGGTDPDDFQSLVHLLTYADVLDIEGLVSSPFGEGRKEQILDVIACYEKDFAHLKTYSDHYSTPEALRGVTKQGETEVAPYDGVRRGTEGSDWIIQCARREDPRPLHLLVWGGIEDLAQALHDAPDILPKLRVYYIGGPNKKWSPDAYQYLAYHFSTLWMIEANSTYRGWFVGGDQSGEWANKEFVARHVNGHGALGDFFVSKKDDLKMGDTPSVGWLLKGSPEDPSQPGWGGHFVRAWERSGSHYERLPTEDDRMEVFGVLELALPLGADAPQKPEVHLLVDNQSLLGHVAEDKTVRFRFCPKESKVFHFTLRGNVPSLDGETGGITVETLSPDLATHPSAKFPHWWTDDPSPPLAEGPHSGAKTVSQWREEFLRDFAARMDRCKSPNSTKRNTTE